jgi:hypothetical protein
LGALTEMFQWLDTENSMNINLGANPYSWVVSSCYYWSSTETGIESAWRHNFSFGMSGFIADRGNEYFVRAVKVF